MSAGIMHNMKYECHKKSIVWVLLILLIYSFFLGGAFTYNVKKYTKGVLYWLDSCVHIFYNYFGSIYHIPQYWLHYFFFFHDRFCNKNKKNKKEWQVVGKVLETNTIMWLSLSHKFMQLNTSKKFQLLWRL